jgi:hypothetical protein
LGIRETINRNAAISTVVVICTLIGGAVAIGLELRAPSGKPPEKNYFTIDDGRTWFADSCLQLPPFNHDGAEAVRCYVFEGKDGKFAGLLQKYDPDTQAALAKRAVQVLPLGAPVMVKKPGEKNWTKMGPEALSLVLMRITAPDGSDAEPVMP